MQRLSLPDAISRELPALVGRLGLGGVPLVRSAVSRSVINRFGYATTLRPRALSLASDYTSWMSLTDRTYSGRHLPPASDEAIAKLPSEKDVVALYRRERFVAATDTSVMFMFFAQWFTDSFLRTSLTDWRKNESNHEIDLCQIYGRTINQTNVLRSFDQGRLKSQTINGEEYPEYLFEPRTGAGEALRFKPEFDGLFDPTFITDVILPGMSGIELAITVKRIFPDCKILLCSGQAAAVDLLDTATSAGHRFTLLAKPVHPQDILNHVAQRIGRSPATQQRTHSSTSA